jgi:hypothetical protein
MNVSLFTHVALFFTFEHFFSSQNVGTLALLTSRPDNNATNVEESLAEGMFGIHPFDDLTAFCIEKESLKHKMWVGGKDDWLVISDNRCSVTLNNIITRDTIHLPSLTTMGQFQISTLYDLEIVNEVCSRRLRHIVLCHTPSSIKGYMVIALCDDGLIASTSKGMLDGKRLGT